jgi:hypothetical protein
MAVVGNGLRFTEGTWFRSGASSGRNFDTWLTISANEYTGMVLEWRYSDGRPNEKAYVDNSVTQEVTGTEFNIG